MTRSGRLIRDSLIFAVGGLSSKFVALILVPLYTRRMTPSEFGLSDVFQTAGSLLYPLVCANIFDAVFRFAMDTEEEPKRILAAGLSVASIGAVFMTVAAAILEELTSLSPIRVWLLYAIVTSQAFLSVLSQFAKATERNWLFSLSGLTVSVSLGVSGVVLVGVLRGAVEGFLGAIAISNVCGLVFLVLGLPVWRWVDGGFPESTLLQRMLRFSMPLMPNAVMWWIVTVANRYIVVLMLGTSASGILAAASKIPGLATMAGGLLLQGWQVTAVRESKSEDQQQFYSQALDYFVLLYSASASLLLVVLRPLMFLFVGSGFSNTWVYVPPLLLGAVFSSLAAFMAVHFIVAKRTMSVLITTLWSAVVAIGLTVLSVPWIGISGAAIASLVAFLFLLLVRIHLVRKRMGISPQPRLLWGSFVVLGLQSALTYVADGWVLVLIQLVLMGTLLILNRSLIAGIVRRIHRRTTGD